MPNRPISAATAYRLIVVADIQEYSREDRLEFHRTAARGGLRNALSSAFDKVLAESGKTWSACEVRDTGDGYITIVPPDASISPVLCSLGHELSAELRTFNAVSAEEARIQVRLAMHVGAVPARGTSDDLILTTRLVHADALKSALDSSPDDVLGLIASDSLYQRMVRNDPRADPNRYREVPVAVRSTNTIGWIRLW